MQATTGSQCVPNCVFCGSHLFMTGWNRRRKYDKRTSSADWGDDGRASFLEEERFQRQMIQNMAMQAGSKSGRI